MAEVERGLEAMRRREVGRRLRKLPGLNQEGRTTVDRLTKDLLRHAVLEALERAGRGDEMSLDDAEVIREMFPAG